MSVIYDVQNNTINYSEKVYDIQTQLSFAFKTLNQMYCNSLLAILVKWIPRVWQLTDWIKVSSKVSNWKSMVKQSTQHWKTDWFVFSAA